MKQEDIFKLIKVERQSQEEKWGTKFDSWNTPNDWVAYITQYLGKAVLYPFSKEKFHLAIIKVAALCFAILERDDYAPRHYDI